MRRKIIFSLVIAVVAASVTFFVKANSNNDKVAYQIALEQIESITNDEINGVKVKNCYTIKPMVSGQVWGLECASGTSSSSYLNCNKIEMYISSDASYMFKCISDVF